MSLFKPVGISISALFLLGACTVDRDSVVFVTKTSIGIDVDSTPRNASIDYHRTEGYLAPSYPNGAIPPVIASIDGDTEIFQPNIQQLYATGKATDALFDDSVDVAEDELILPTGDQKQKLMFFGTSTSTGIKIGFGATPLPIPDSFLFGYRRKEFSYVPLGKVTEEIDGQTIEKHVYPALLASYNSKTKAAGAPEDSGHQVTQFFATGTAAVHLAKQDAIRNVLIGEAENALQIYHLEASSQRGHALEILKCVTIVSNEKFEDVIGNAKETTAIVDTQQIDRLKAIASQGLAARDPKKREDELQKARALYASDIALIRTKLRTRSVALMNHRKFVCELAKQAKK